MTDDNSYTGYSSDLVDRIWNLGQLHRRLSGYYRAKVKDSKTIEGLWKRIEAEEHILERQGLKVK